MKKLQRLCMAGVFTLMLTTTAFAGDIHTGIAPPPPSSAPASALGDIQTPGMQNLQATSDSVLDITLNLLQTMLSVF